MASSRMMGNNMLAVAALLAIFRKGEIFGLIYIIPCLSQYRDDEKKDEEQRHVRQAAR